MSSLIPELSSLAWYLASQLFSQRSIKGMYASVSSFLVGVALNAPRTVRKPWFCTVCSCFAKPFGLPCSSAGCKNRIVLSLRLPTSKASYLLTTLSSSPQGSCPKAHYFGPASRGQLGAEPPPTPSALVCSLSLHQPTMPAAL